MEQKEFKEELETRKMKLIKELVSISGFDFAKNNSKINIYNNSELILSVIIVIIVIFLYVFTSPAPAA